MLEMVSKVFYILLGIVAIVSIYYIFTSITTSSCYPTELYNHDETTGFQTGIFDNVFDVLCSKFTDMNSGVMQLYKKWYLSGMKSSVVSVSNSIWNMGKSFCQTHSNLNYADEEGNDADDDGNDECAGNDDEGA